MCRIFRVANCHHPLGIPLSHFLWLIGVVQFNAEELGSNQEVSLPLTLTVLNYDHLRPGFPQIWSSEKKEGKKKAFVISFSERPHQWNLKSVVMIGEPRKHVLFLLNKTLFTKAIVENSIPHHINIH